MAISASTVDHIMGKASKAFKEAASKTFRERSIYLTNIAENLLLAEQELIGLITAETFLPEARVKSELQRTVGQLRAFAVMLEKGDWLQASIDTALPERKPVPKPDLRKTFIPLGPIVVFGASNFPLAYSTAGGDTAAALASGCSVVVKSHPAHPQTSAFVANIVIQAGYATNMPEHIFQHVEDGSIETGALLVKHPLAKGVAFTGSYAGGRALFDLASERPEPIPVFAEMGSTNPIVVLPEAMKNGVTADAIASSVLLGAGQFCTKPGLLLVQESERAENFIEQLKVKFSSATGAKMLHDGIANNFKLGRAKALQEKGVTPVYTVPDAGEAGSGYPALALTTAENFFAHETLRAEVFGPFSLVIMCKDQSQMLQLIESLHGQLTISVFGAPEEIERGTEFIHALQRKCGRLIFGGVPTGVEVCKSMQHGGPFPATTDGRFTSVGVDSIYRFVRPVSYQNFPQALLPVELKNDNTLGILRCVNNEWTRASLS